MISEQHLTDCWFSIDELAIRKNSVTIISRRRSYYHETQKHAKVLLSIEKSDALCRLGCCMDRASDKNTEHLRKDSVNQTKDFYHSELDYMRIKDLDGKDISPESRKAAKELTDAALDGDKEALIRLGKNILQNPELREGVTKALISIDALGNISFDKDTNGNLHMRLSGAYEPLSINKEGKFEDAHYNIKTGSWSYSEAKNADESTISARDGAQYQINERIEAQIFYLTFKNQLPADTKSNMQSLEEDDWTDMIAARKRIRESREN